MRKLFNRKNVAKPILLMMLFSLVMPMLTYGQTMQSGTGVSMDLRIVPTSIVVTPVNSSAAEGSAAIQYTATANYNYPAAPTPIPPRNVTNDPMTVWASSVPSVALTNTVGLVTPVSDLNTGSANSIISATYAGVAGQTILTVTGTVTTTPPNNGGGAGAGVLNPPSEGGVPVNNNPPTENPPTETNNPPTETNNPPTETNNPPTTTPTTTPNGTNPPSENPREIFGQQDTPYLPLENPVRPDEILPVEDAPVVPDAPPEGGVSRGYVVAAIADKLDLLTLRKSLLDRCYADLENCTNIFRMYSSYDGITLDPDNLKLFPDVGGSVRDDKINKMALLGIVQGYYGVEESPFLPEKSISNVETLKVLSSVLATLEKGKPTYKGGRFDYNSLFYQEIYAASLLSEASESNAATTLSQLSDSSFVLVKVAHALSDQAWALIKLQGTPFRDVRPNLYDTHWYYPIVYNKICPLKLIDCTPQSEAKPDATPTSDEVIVYINSFEKYIKSENLDKDVVGDVDKDGVSNLDENLIYYTNPSLADTDEDTVKDGEEISTYKTNPNLADTDTDGLNDGDEIAKHKTDPNLEDTDTDGFTDGVEIEEGSDPLDKASVPDDKNNNTISDEWEFKYNIDVADGSQDTDSDGVADLLEYKYGTDPTKIDTDADGYTDSEEILDLLSDPKDATSPGSPEDLPVVINNFQYGQMIAEPSPLIKGVGPASLGDNVVQIQILLRNEFGSELVLGSTETDAKGRFVFVPTIEIKNGTYFLLARSINKGEVKTSSPVKIIIDSSLQVATAIPEKLEDAEITDDVLIKNLVLKVDSTDGKPVLYGSLSEFGSRVNVTWQSLVVSSALIADSTDGSFSVKAPPLEEGRHTVYIQTVRKRDNAMGKTLKISFDLGKKAEVATTQNPSGLQANLAGILSIQGVTDFVSKQSWPFWIGLVVVIVLVGGGVYFFALDDGSKKKKKK